MNSSERRIVVSSLNIESVQDLLLSSREAIAAYNIPIGDALWSAEDSALYLKMRTSSLHQGQKGICFGGFTAALIDLTAGFAGFVKAAEIGKIVLSRDLSVSFHRPVPINSLLEVHAKVEGVEEDGMVSSAKIIKAGGEKILASGILVMKIDNGLRLTR